MEHGELGVRPLRNAKATDEYVLRGVGVETWEPTFTFHGFRYVEVDGWPGDGVDLSAFVAVVIHSDFEQTGFFSCSNDLLNRLHQNAEWGLRGNFVDVPTDCPQRDERLGWTGDLQTFAADGIVHVRRGRFPGRLVGGPEGRADRRWAGDAGRTGRATRAVPDGEVRRRGWGDAATIVPWTLYQRFGDKGVLARQFDSMRAWVDFVRALVGETLLWPEMFQLGDWLTRRATGPALAGQDGCRARGHGLFRPVGPPGQPGGPGPRVGRTWRTSTGQLADDVRRAFRQEYVTSSGLVSSDSVTAYSLALMFDLYDNEEHRARAGARIALLSAARGYPGLDRLRRDSAGAPRALLGRATPPRPSVSSPRRPVLLALPGDHGGDDDVGALGRHAAGRIHQSR